MNEPVDILKINEVLAEKFLRIEESLPTYLTIKDLFEKLLARIEEEFQIPFIWISILNEENAIDIIKALKSSHILKDRVNIIGRTVLLNLSINFSRATRNISSSPSPSLPSRSTAR
jgi:hypothetical protein